MMTGSGMKPRIDATGDSIALAARCPSLSNPPCVVSCTGEVVAQAMLENGTTRAGDVLGRRANARGCPGSHIQVYILGK